MSKLTDCDILAIDPGLRDLGLAVLHRGRLTGAWWVRTSTPLLRCDAPLRPPCQAGCLHASRPEAIGATADEVMLTLRQAGLHLSSFAVLVMEWPQVYDRQAVPSDDLLAIAGLVGAMTSRAHEVDVLVWHVQPREWKGGTAKDTFQTWILAALEEAERALIPRGPRSGRYASDALDAVGLALWAVDRLRTWKGNPSNFRHLVEPVGRPSKDTETLSMFRKGKLECGTKRRK